MDFKNGVVNIKAAGYSGPRTVFDCKNQCNSDNSLKIESNVEYLSKINDKH